MSGMQYIHITNKKGQKLNAYNDQPNGHPISQPALYATYPLTSTSTVSTQRCLKPQQELTLYKEQNSTGLYEINGRENNAAKRSPLGFPEQV